jgi:hypothetical protein
MRVVETLQSRNQKTDFDVYFEVPSKIKRGFVRRLTNRLSLRRPKSSKNCRLGVWVTELLIELKTLKIN